MRGRRSYGQCMESADDQMRRMMDRREHKRAAATALVLLLSYSLSGIPVLLVLRPCCRHPDSKPASPHTYTYTLHSNSDRHTRKHSELSCFFSFGGVLFHSTHILAFYLEHFRRISFKFLLKCYDEEEEAEKSIHYVSLSENHIKGKTHLISVSVPVRRLLSISEMIPLRIPKIVSVPLVNSGQARMNVSRAAKTLGIIEFAAESRNLAANSRTTGNTVSL